MGRLEVYRSRGIHEVGPFHLLGHDALLEAHVADERHEHVPWVERDLPWHRHRVAVQDAPMAAGPVVEVDVDVVHGLPLGIEVHLERV